MKSTNKSVMHEQNVCFTLYMHLSLFDVLVAVADVVAKARYWFTLVPVNVPDF